MNLTLPETYSALEELQMLANANACMLHKKLVEQARSQDVLSSQMNMVTSNTYFGFISVKSDGPKLSTLQKSIHVRESHLEEAN